MQILRDYMSTPVISISPDANIFEAAKLMSEKKVSCLLVEDGDAYSGMITHTDIINRVLANFKNPGEVKVDEACTRPLLTMDYLLTVNETRDKLLRKNVKRLAVTEQGKVVGVFSLKDFVKA